MTSLSRKSTESVFAPKIRLVWLALAGFFLGSALCPFNPLAGDGRQSLTKGEIMNSPSQNRTVAGNEYINRSAPAAREIETATFALG